MNLDDPFSFLCSLATGRRLAGESHEVVIRDAVRASKHCQQHFARQLGVDAAEIVAVLAQFELWLAEEFRG
jgi:hypothetical protein